MLFSQTWPPAQPLLVPGSQVTHASPSGLLGAPPTHTLPDGQFALVALTHVLAHDPGLALAAGRHTRLHGFTAMVGVQAPMPSHSSAWEPRPSAEHLVPQLVPAAVNWHLPPWQNSVLPQAVDTRSMQLSSLTPLATGTHLPAVAPWLSQRSHSPQRRSQQTLSTQNPDWQLVSPPVLHDTPLALAPPQRPTPVIASNTQALLLRQSLSLVHGGQSPPTHLLLAPHENPTAVWQAPLPLHFAALVPSVTVVHAAAMHWTVLGSRAQPPLPLQKPVLPHAFVIVCAGQVKLVAVVPRFVQVPSDADRVQLLQPAHALVLQQTPDTQNKAAAQSEVTPQSWPFAEGPQRWLLHLLGIAHCGLSPVPVHELKQLVPSAVQT